MDTQTVRKKYLDFFAARNHVVIPSASLIPENDPTTLFTGSGMQPLLPYLLGESHPEGNRLVDSQKSFRAEDIEEVGDNRHTTFFEMLGNWSLGDYFKHEQLPWFYEFLTQEVGIDPNNLYVTVFSGDEKNGIPRDEESAAIWSEIFTAAGIETQVADIGSEEAGYARGMKDGERIFYYEAKKNWWSRAGVPNNMPVGEPGGPDSEMFYDFGIEHDKSFGEHCHPNCDCGRFMEIGNSVFMEYMKTENGFEKLPQKNVDFGGGLERIAAAAAHNPDVFLAVDSLHNVVMHLEKASGKAYADDQKSFRIIADHLRGAVFMIADGVRPSNTEQGYFARRLLRRSVQYADALGIAEGTLSEAVGIIIATYKDHYNELTKMQTDIEAAVAEEETKFRRTLVKGMNEFKKRVQKGSVSGEDAFTLFTSYGFPLELTEELAVRENAHVDVEDFKKRMKEHQEKSRAGAEKRFKGGLADHSEKTIQYHTTHHILLRALQDVLGPHVKQRGSNITSERLRFDFVHDAKMTDEEKEKVQRLVNERIQEHLPVHKTVMPKTRAEELGAEQEFGQKYGDTVNVYSVGPKDATVEDPKFEQSVSLEFCGGPHVANTKDIDGTFRIVKEESSSAGIRRIRGVLE